MSLRRPENLKTQENDDDDDDDDDDDEVDDDSSDHFHCYLLRSQDPKHPYKTYVGFTVNPHRRIRQHNGLLKHGGAWRTKRSGRPWQFEVIIHGFATQKMALQFEWAWQHCDRSLAVRAAIGDDVARKLKRKRGLRGQLEILKTMILQCPGLYSQRNLGLYFFDESTKSTYEGLKVQRTGETPEICLNLVPSLEAMPFYSTRNRPSRKRRGKALAQQEEDREVVSAGVETHNLPAKKVDCIWCRRTVRQDDILECFRCWNCQGCFHELCASIHFGHGDKKCPGCKSTIENYESDNSDISGDAGPGDGNSFDCEDDDSSVASLSSEPVLKVVPSQNPTEKGTTGIASTKQPNFHPTIPRNTKNTFMNDHLGFTSSDEESRSMGDSREFASIISTKSPGMRIFSPSPRGANDIAFNDAPKQNFTSPLNLRKFQDMSLTSPCEGSSCMSMFTSPQDDSKRAGSNLLNERPGNDRSIICIEDDSDSEDDLPPMLPATHFPSHGRRDVPGMMEVIDICSP